MKPMLRSHSPLSFHSLHRSSRSLQRDGNEGKHVTRRSMPKPIKWRDKRWVVEVRDCEESGGATVKYI